MNPDQQTPTPGQVPAPQQLPQPSPPPPPTVTIPGQGPVTTAPVLPLAPQQQPAVDHSPYEFIMNAPKRPKSPNPLTTGSTLKRALIAGGGLVLILILFVVISSFLKGGGNKAPLLSVLQEQTELVRVASEATTNSSNNGGIDQNTEALAYSVQLSITSAQQQLTAYLTNNKIKFDAKLLGAKKSTATDSQLQTAQQSNNYSTAFAQAMTNDLTSYSQALQAAYRANPGPRGQQLLGDQYSAAQLLLKQAGNNAHND